MDPVKFKSYNGKWPNLCSGTLVLTIGDTEYVFYPGFLKPGGRCRYDRRSMKTSVEKGAWLVSRFSDWPIDFPVDRREEALDVINSSVPHGCCGGCL